MDVVWGVVSIDESEPRFFLHVDGRVLCCQMCGSRTRIEDRPGAKVEAQDAHVCGLACGGWSVELHASTGEVGCAGG